MIRKSTSADFNQLYECFSKCFGARGEDYKALQNLDGRYYVYELDGKIIAFTGIEDDGEFTAPQITYTGVDPDYRGHGYLAALFEEMLENHTGDLYCSCWRMLGRPINLHYHMVTFGFEPVAVPHKSWFAKHECPDSFICVNRCGENCRCFEDLYLRRG